MPFGVFPTWSTWSFAVSCQRTIETKECECHARLLCGGKIEMYSMFQIKSKVHIWGRICVCSCCQNGKNWWDAWDKKWSHTTVFEFPTFFNNYDIQHENRSIRFMHFYKLTSNALKCLFSSFSRHFLLMTGFFLLFFWCDTHYYYEYDVIKHFSYDEGDHGKLLISALWQTASY